MEPLKRPPKTPEEEPLAEVSQTSDKKRQLGRQELSATDKSVQDVSGNIHNIVGAESPPKKITRRLSKIDEEKVPDGTRSAEKQSTKILPFSLQAPSHPSETTSSNDFLKRVQETPVQPSQETKKQGKEPLRKLDQPVTTLSPVDKKIKTGHEDEAAKDLAKATKSLSQLPPGSRLAFNGNNELVWVKKITKGEWVNKYGDIQNVKTLIDLDSAKFVVKDEESNRAGKTVNVKRLYYVDNNKAEFRIKAQGLEQIGTFEEKIKTSWDNALNPLNEKNLKFNLNTGKMVSIDDALKNSKFPTKRKVHFHHDSKTSGLFASVDIQAKGYLPEGEFCGDYATVDHIGDITLAVVADAAGNKGDSKNGAVHLTNRMRALLINGLSNSQEKGHVTLGDVGNVLRDAMVRAQLAHQGGLDMMCTMAFTFVLKTDDGRSFAVGACVGDSRVMVRKSDGKVKDLTPSEYDGEYRDSGGSFGEVINRLKPKIFIQELQGGDNLFLGSDGFGDNMEAKTQGKTPIVAFRELKKADKLPKELKDLENEQWLNDATSPACWFSSAKSVDVATKEWCTKYFPATKASFSTESPAPDEITKGQQLQKLHEAYTEHTLELLTTGSKNFSKTIHQHCTESQKVNAGLLGIGIQKKIIEEKTKVTEVDKKKNIEKNICNESIEDIYEYAINLVGQKAANELKKTWKDDPVEGLNWLSNHSGKSDDFSLVTIEIKGKNRT